MVTLLNVDCMEYMATVPDKQFDLAIVDPPYGMVGNVFQMKSKNLMKNGAKSMRLDDTNSSIGFNLNKPPKQEYFNQLFRISKNQIIFGMQYFTKYLPPHQCVIVWDKINGGSFFSDAEIAYTSFDFAVRLARIHNPTNKRIHPTQKPIKLYDWILNNYSEKGSKIFDSHLGSGSSAIAAHYYGCDFVGCEIDKEYFDAAQKRFKQLTAQTTIF